MVSHFHAGVSQDSSDPGALGLRVTLCTITHNRPALLELLAECVVAQGYPRELLEWVIVDDSTSDLAPDLKSVQQAGITLNHVLLPQRLSIGAKRNLCHGLAHGELLVLLDDDDYYPPSRVPDAVAALSSGDVQVAGCDRLPLLLLPEASLWLTPGFGAGHATANTLAYRRSYVEAGHRFDPDVAEAEEAAFLEQFHTPIHQLDPQRTLTCMGHGANTVDKRLWISRIGEHRFERQPALGLGWPPLDYLQRYARSLGLDPPSCLPSSAQTTRSTAAQRRDWRVAVVTPYHAESLELLHRCHASVLSQEHPCTHVLVADGPGYPELGDWECRHILLGVGHGDNGNTPRSIGALAAMNEGFDCIAFLDVDNWLAPDHLSRAIATQADGGYEVVFSDRHIVFPNGHRLTELPQEDRTRRHADTSCMVLFEPAFSTLALWAQMPRLMAPQCDRVVFAQLMATKRCGWSETPTVFFETWYSAHFLAAGLLPPVNAKFPRLHPAADWQQAAVAFRQRCPTPVYLGADGVGSEKPRIQIVSILGPARSGGTLLQGALCRHLGFQGIPEHQFLYHWIARLGPDHRQRYPGDELRRILAQSLPEDSRLKPHDLQTHGLEQALKAERSYTLLEAYFRAVQALIPGEAMDFARAYGQLIVLDRSCSHALVADVLFRCLPEHRTVLLLRDPLQQIAEVRRMEQRFPQHWEMAEEQRDLSRLCAVYLQSLATPLMAAPVGQLHLVLSEQLMAEQEPVVEQVSCFLGLVPNILFALEPLPLPADHVFNPVHDQAYAACLAELPQQLLRDEPWKQECLTLEQAPQRLEPWDSLEPLTELEQHWLALLMQPISELFTWLSDRQLQPDLEPPRLTRAGTSGVTDLEMLVAEVAEGLLRHGTAGQATIAF